ncbi:MAG: CooT family nickel-binding protein [Thermodesulfobacteriota bacterium]|jgi:predicted RNA-binding protein|nr:MAG: CooT family nickel-binding protein [Thermodesulfobacteriota bacterium]
MCETNAFLERGGGEELLLENVDVIEVVDGTLRLINIFGEEKKIKGSLKKFSLRESKIVFREDS